MLWYGADIGNERRAINVQARKICSGVLWSDDLLGEDRKGS